MHSTCVTGVDGAPVAASIFVFMSRVIAIIARAISFFGSGRPLPRSAVWQ
jgi:hypothetical protein